jgi:hypothetical protein
VTLDIARFVRYARARVYAIAVRIHAAVYFGGSLGTRTPMEFDCPCNCEAVGGPLECYCTHPPQDLPCTCTVACIPESITEEQICRERMIPAPFTGTPYDPDSEED